MNAPKAFVSYSHDSAEHKAWVLRLASDLRANGVDATLDQWDLTPGQDIVAFMGDGISESQRVILICSDAYVSKAEAGVGGVGFERLIVTAELVQNLDTKKFIPIVRANASRSKVPNFLGPRLYVDFTSDADYETKLEELLREILGVPASTKPPLGTSRFSGLTPEGSSAPRVAGPTGRTQEGVSLLDNPWFEDQARAAIAGIGRLGIRGHMEIRLGLHEELNKSQIELLSAVTRSQIHTFGWPIGVVAEGREEFEPKPFSEGIRAEIAISNDRWTGRTSYDYWALKNAGDFLLLQTLFEDQRAKEKVYFNTRIVRVAETLMFAADLYENLSVPAETRLSVRVVHRGLAGRELSSSNPNRSVRPATSREDEARAEIVTPIGELRSGLVQHVRRITAPMFMLFNFTEFADRVYHDIVTRFERGEVT